MRHWMFVSIYAWLWCLSVTAGTNSCLDDFRPVEPLHPEVVPENTAQTSEPSFAWYNQCLLVGTPRGLHMYDVNQLGESIEITSVAVTNVAADTKTATIAFAIANVPSVHLLRPNSQMVSISFDGDMVTGITFSHDGMLLAIASVYVAPPGFEGSPYLDSRIDILTVDGTLISTLANLPLIILDTYFSVDSRKLLVRAADPGYFGDKVTYWDVQSASRLWRYYEDLLPEQERSPNDPLIVTATAMRENLVALGGVDGYFNDDNFYGQAVHLWDAAAGRRLIEIILNRRDGHDLYELISPALAFSSDGSVLVTATGNSILRFWDTVSGMEIDMVQEQGGLIREVAFSPEDTFIAVRTDAAIAVVHLTSRERTVLSTWAAPP